MSTYTLTDTGKTLRWESGAEPPARLYAIDRFTALADGEPDANPGRLYFGSEQAATVAAIAWASSEPWRRSAQVWTYAPGYTVGLKWYARNIQQPGRPVVCDDERAPEPRALRTR